MINAVEIFDPAKLRELISTRFNPPVRVIQANTQVDTTNTPFYITLQTVTSTPQGMRKYTKGGAETEYSQSTDNVLYSIQLIGKNSILLANRLRVSLRLTSTLNELKKMNIGILQVSAVRDISLALDSGYEERSQFDLLVSQCTIVKEQQNHINSVDLDIHIEQ